MNVTVVGLGLIGGSMALDLKRQINVNVKGVDANIAHQHMAMEQGLVHQIISIDEACRWSDLIILAIPVHVIEEVLSEVMDKIQKHTVVTDVGSTKFDICQNISGHKNRIQYVAAHPLAGTEFSGPKAAIEGLFRGKKNIICDRESSSAYAIETIEKVFGSLGMNNVFMDAAAHDKHMAYVSHLSHISSFTLSLTVLDIEEDEKQIFNLASTGFASTVRLAKSNPETWGPIFSKNSEHLSKALDQYISRLNEFKQALDNNNMEQSIALMKKANVVGEILEKK